MLQLLCQIRGVAVEAGTYVEPEAGCQTVDDILVDVVLSAAGIFADVFLRQCQVFVDEAVHLVERCAGVVLALLCRGALGHERHGEPHHAVGLCLGVEALVARLVVFEHRGELHVAEGAVGMGDGERLLHLRACVLLVHTREDAVGVVDEAVIIIVGVAGVVGKVGGCLQRLLVVPGRPCGGHSVEHQVAPVHIAGISPVAEGLIPAAGSGTV